MRIVPKTETFFFHQWQQKINNPFLSAKMPLIFLQHFYVFVYLPMRPGPGRNYTTGITGRQDQRTSNEGNTNALTWFPYCDIV
jgi:hypothetical protein